jgi:hypothetical protein
MVRVTILRKCGFAYVEVATPENIAKSQTNVVKFNVKMAERQSFQMEFVGVMLQWYDVSNKRSMLHVGRAKRQILRNAKSVL